MGGRSALFGLALAVIWGACEKPEPRPERLEVASAHRACEEGDLCGVVETSCLSKGCECGVAVEESHLIDYQRKLAECRGDQELEVCEQACETPFAKCFNGACVMTNEPQEVYAHGRSMRGVCERTLGTYVGCPQCSPSARCPSCVPCDCPSSHRWTKKGCRAVVKTEARDILVEATPTQLTRSDWVKIRVKNNAKRKIWLKTVCGTPLHRARKKEDAWERGYEPFHELKCRVGAVQLNPGERRGFVVRHFGKFRSPEGDGVSPGTYRFELTYTDYGRRFVYRDVVYSSEFDVLARISRR